MEPEFPLEFIVDGTPVSVQTKRAVSKAQWQKRVKDASGSLLEEGSWASTGRIGVTLFYFPASIMEGDIDNIVKPILDALNSHIYLDDHQVERVVVQKFEPGNLFEFRGPSDILREAIGRAKPNLYVRVSADPFEDLV